MRKKCTNLNDASSVKYQESPYTYYQRVSCNAVPEPGTRVITRLSERKTVFTPDCA